jgi:putative acetyltransferase
MIDIIPFSENLREQVLTVWEKSVLATHHFLTPTDFEIIKSIVRLIDFNAFPVFVLISADQVIGFIGVSEGKVEMLFISPKHFGQGHGKKLMEFVMNTLGAHEVDVNEQNLDAVKFYKKLGFEVYERTEKDNAGMDYPILKMRLKVAKR